jgi:ATP-dependent DNA helicase RecG
LHLFEGPYLKRAAALLFHEDPEQYVTGAYVKIGFFKTDTDLIYQDEIHGNLFQQVDSTIDLLLTKYMKAYIGYEGLQRVERYLFPAPALREALLNAVVHKDYSSGNPVQISVYEDKIIFWNAGRLPDELSIELLQKKHPSIPYNPLVASAFFRAGYIEAWGRGIEKINNECKVAGVPAPEINHEFAGLMITFQARSGEVSGKTTQKTTQKILSILKENPSASRKEIAVILGDITEDGVKYQLNKMKKEKILERIGPAKGGYWKIIEKFNRIDDNE